MTGKLSTSITLFILLTLAGAAFAAAAELSFAEAVQLLNEESTSLRIAGLNLQIALLDYDRAIAANLMAGSEHSRLQAELNLAKAENTYGNALHNNYLEAFRQYTDVLAAERSLQISRGELVIAEHNYKVLQEKVRLGDAGRLDELREINRLQAAQRAVENAENTWAESRRALQSLLNLDDEDFKLVTEFTLPEFELNLGQCLEAAVENSFEIWEGESSLQLQEMQLQKSRIDGTAPLDLKRAELALEIARLNHRQSLQELRERAIASFQGLKQSRARFISVQRELEIAEESRAISAKQAELGLISEIQLQEAHLDLLRAKSNLEDALVSATISQIQLEQLLGLEVERP